MRTRGSQTQEAPASASADHDNQIQDSFLSNFKNVDSAPLSRLQKPDGGPTADFVQLLQQQLLKASCSGVLATAQVLPAPVCRHIIKEVTAILKTEPPLVELTPSASQQRVTVFGGSALEQPHSVYVHYCRMGPAGIVNVNVAVKQSYAYQYNQHSLATGCAATQSYLSTTPVKHHYHTVALRLCRGSYVVCM
jgi:hypothetical protein